MVRATLIVTVCGSALAGCAGAPVGWGGTHEVLHRDASKITIQYDGLVESLENVAAVARNHCNSYGKQAVVSNVLKDSATFGIIRTYTYDCVGSSNRPVGRSEPPIPQAATAQAPPPQVATKGQPGQFSFEAERVARAENCSAAPVASLTAKGPGFESYTVACSNGDALDVRCDFGRCRALK